MTNITPVYWEANGLSLHTHAWAIETKSGSRAASAPKRGNDRHVPYQTGLEWIKKMREPRTLELPMWVRPINPDGTEDTTMSKDAKLQANWDYLHQFFDEEGQFPFVKRWWRGNEVAVASGLGEVLDPPVPGKVGKNTWRFTLSVFMADPWFYGSPITEAIGNITVEGTAHTHKVELTMGNGRITFPDGNWIQYNGSGTVVIDCEKGSVRQGTVYLNGLVDRNPRFPEWPKLKPGPNALTGAGSIKYYPAYR